MVVKQSSDGTTTLGRLAQVEAVMGRAVRVCKCRLLDGPAARRVSRFASPRHPALLRLGGRWLRATFGLASTIVVAATLVVGLGAPAWAQYKISQVPMLVANPPPANIVLTIDDSGSMTYAYVPDYVGQYPSAAGFASSSYNSIYYNPAITYNIPPDANNNPVPTTNCAPNPASCALTSFKNAYYDGFNPDLGAVDLSQNYTVTLTMNYNGGSPPTVTVAPASAGTSGNPSPAFYYLFVPSGNCVAPSPGQAPPADSCYTQVTVSTTSGPALCATATGTVLCSTLAAGQQNQIVAAGWDETQNFANWFSFYRIRHLSLISAAAQGMQNASLANTRVAWQALNTCADSFTNTNCQGWRGTQFDDRISQFSGQHKIDFYNWLFQLPAGQSTPTRVAWWRVGNYFSDPTLGSNGPYGLDPNDPSNLQATVTGHDLLCAYNFNVTLTDGLWNRFNENGQTNFCGIDNTQAQCGNTDNTSTTFPDGTIYTPSTTSASTTIYGDGNGGGDSAISDGGLSDIAFYYWSTNLRPDLTGFYVPPYYAPQSPTNPIPSTVNPTTGNPNDPTWPYWNPINDPATWPHLVNFTVGVGLTGFLQYPGLQWSGDAHSGAAYTNLQTAAPNCTSALNPASPTCVWPPIDVNGSGNGYTGALDGAGNVYDLWHAAINSRGNAFSSETPQDLVTAMQTIFSRIQGQIHGNSAAAGSSPSLTASTDLYVASYEGSDWHGIMTAYGLDALGNVIPTAVWQTSASSIPSVANRQVFTANSALPTSGSPITASPGIPFDTTDLNNAGLLVSSVGWGSTAVNPNPVVNYLLGDASNEQRNGGTYRNRPVTVLGDFVDSNPVYSWQENFGYQILPEGQGPNGYVTFLASKANRPPMVYAGANDGMLHGFNATNNTSASGNEVFAYVPHSVISILPALDDPNYLHHFYVDGPTFVGDAYFNNGWHSVLIGTTGAGGPGIFALDVTSPQSFDAADVLWDMDANAGATTPPTGYDADLGYTIGQPIIARLNDGSWDVIFGNGYLSYRGCAVLYIVRLPDGLVRSIDTSGVSSGSQCVNAAGTNSNGLGSPTLFDVDQNGTTDFVYAGDLFGHMWKFDLSSSNPSNWAVAYTTGAAPAPLFTATTSTGVPQPIIAASNLGPSPGNSNALLVYFVTGRLFATGDPSNTTTQSVYAIQDQGSPITATLRSTLVQQSVIAATDGSGNENIKTPYATVDLTVSDGWFIDLPNAGERALSTPQLVGGMLMFSTVIPQLQPCNGGCGGFIYAVNQFNGDGGLNFLVDTANNVSYDAIATLVGCVKGLTLITKGSTLEWYASGNGVNFSSGGSGSTTTAGGALGGPGNTGVGINTAIGASSTAIQHGAGNLNNSGRISWHEQIINQ